ncbi:kinase-like protein [Ceratobasidium sp. AG-I]|nr:kinase-like protein [Ceratobasidium sp. AG-I]
MRDTSRESLQPSNQGESESESSGSLPWADLENDGSINNLPLANSGGPTSEEHNQRQRDRDVTEDGFDDELDEKSSDNARSVIVKLWAHIKQRRRGGTSQLQSPAQVTTKRRTSKSEGATPPWSSSENISTGLASIYGEATRHMVSGAMSATEIMKLLNESGCTDLTSDLDLKSCSSLAVLGGGFGDVYEGRLRNGLLVAIKCPRLFLVGNEQSRGALKDVARELYAWSKCKHRNIAELLGMAAFRNQIAMVSPWMTNGTMPQYLNQNPSACRFKISIQIAMAVEYLHSIDVVHGDIKGANILVSEHGQAKLSDFGNSLLKYHTLQFSGASQMPSFSLRWAAPELIEGSTKSSKEADVYALGMTILEAFSGDVPYVGKSDYVVMYSVAFKNELPTQPNNTMEPLWPLVLSCWSRDPAQRPSSSYVVRFLLPLAKGEQDTLHGGSYNEATTSVSSRQGDDKTIIATLEQGDLTPRPSARGEDSDAESRTETDSFTKVEETSPRGSDNGEGEGGKWHWDGR